MSMLQFLNLIKARIGELDIKRHIVLIEVIECKVTEERERVRKRLRLIEARSIVFQI